MHYVDISASDEVLSAIEALDTLAREQGATAALSVGLAPGVTNLLARACLDHLGTVTRADITVDITVLLGLGDRHGEAALRWTIRTLADGAEGNARSARVEVPGHGHRRVYPFAFSDQHALRRTLGVATVTTRLCFDSRPVSRLVFAARAVGLLRPLRHTHVQDRLLGILARAQVGSDRFGVVVSARGPDQAGVTRTLVGHGQSRVTGLVAARVAGRLTTGAPAGVHHLDQLVPPVGFLSQVTAGQVGPLAV